MAIYMAYLAMAMAMAIYMAYLAMAESAKRTI
jgi:hypothetical protein